MADISISERKINLEYKKAFDLIVGKVEAELVKTGYTKQKVATDNENELVALFTSQNLAYSVVYFKDKQQMVLRSCTMTEDGPDNEWKTLATWMLDEEGTFLPYDEFWAIRSGDFWEDGWSEFQILN